MSLQLVKQRPLLVILLLSLFVRVLAAFANVGFMAIDDYVYMLKLAFPAQSAPGVEDVIASSWVHPTIPMLALTWLSQIPLVLGITDPLHQIQVVYLLMGLASLLPVYLGYRIFADIGRRQEALVAALLVGLHCLMPFFSTRVLFETFAMPLIFISLFCFQKFYGTEKLKYLIGAVAAITAASLVRYQSGVCFVAMLGFFIFHRRCRRHLPVFVAISLAFFVLSGALDFLIGRTFHQSFIDYVKYNIEHSSDYGVSKPWNFVLFFLGVSLPPFLFRGLRGFSWRKTYAPLAPAFYFFLVFLFLHSLVPHKEDRFMIPILPVFLILLAPLVTRLWQQGKRGWCGFFAGLNVLILFLAASFTSQWNTIGVARYLHVHNNYDVVFNFSGSLTFIPTAYMNRPDLKIEEVNATDTFESPSCSQLWAVRQDKLSEFEGLKLPVRKIAEASPGPLEWLVVKMNPKRNGRRAAISLFQGEACETPVESTESDLAS